MVQQLQRPRRSRPPTYLEAPYAYPHYMHPTANSSARKRAAKPSQSSDSSSSSPSQSLFRPPTARRPAHRSGIAATDSAHVAWLWKRVMSYTTHTESSKGRRRAKVTSTGSTASASASTFGQRKWQTPATSEASSTGTRKEVAAKITDAD